MKTLLRSGIALMGLSLMMGISSAQDQTIDGTLTIQTNLIVQGGVSNSMDFLANDGTSYLRLQPENQGSCFFGPSIPISTGDTYCVNYGYGSDISDLVQGFDGEGGWNWGVVDTGGAGLIQDNHGWMGLAMAYCGGGNGQGTQIIDANLDNDNEALVIAMADFTFNSCATQLCTRGINYAHLIAYGGGGGGLQRGKSDGITFGVLLDGGYQLNDASAGTFLMGMVNCYNHKGAGNARQTATQAEGCMSLGSLNAVSGYQTEQVLTNSPKGSMNVGYITGGSQVMKGSGSGNFGKLEAGEYQYTTGDGSFCFGSNNSNTYDYACAFGYGVDAEETNSVSARRYWENGEALDQKYAQLAYIPQQGDISMGSFTNMP